MALVLQIKSGARAGQRAEFTRTVVLAGRHSESDLKFDPTKDLDVSTKHAEFRSGNGGWTIQDLGSTNGTFLNGHKISGTQPIRAGDSLSFGERGPRVDVITAGEVSGGVAPATVQRSSASLLRPKTEERIAMAVAKQTGSMKMLLIALAVVVVAGGTYLVMQNKRLSAESQRMIAALQAQNDSLANVSAGRAAGLDSVIQDLKRQRDQLTASLRAGGGVNQRQIDELNRRTQGVKSALAVDWATILEGSNGGIAFVTVRTSGDSAEEGTAFGITASGILATNKHVVIDRAGKPYRDIVVKFADTQEPRYAHFLSMAPGDVDVAFIQLNDAGTYPVVAGVAADPAVRVGEPIMVLGFPLGSGLMGANGPGLIPKTTPGWGNISKSQPTDLQLDAFAAAGSSGSPVFNARGLVVGIVYGGNSQAAGHVVYAVPGAQLVAALPATAKSILK